MGEGQQVVMKIPQAFVDSVIADLDQFLGQEKSLPMHVAERLVGRAGRIAQIVPSARPFAAALYAAQTAAKRSGDSLQPEAPPGRVAVRRFSVVSAWFKALLHDPGLAPVLIQRVVDPHGETQIPMANATIEFDGCPWGGGAVLRVDGVATEYFACKWTEASAAHLGVWTGDSKFQSFWEFLTLLLALIVWGDSYTKECITVLGDSTSALQVALHLSGRREMVAIAREIAWRQIRSAWKFKVGHLPAEFNLVSDSLSRRYSPSPHPLPRLLSGAIERQAPAPMHVRRAAVHFDMA